MLARDVHHVYGFPAHAGMDPPTVRDGRSWPGLPRTRGDGPFAIHCHPTGTTASPHTRGWTQPKSLHDEIYEGFPAHAGMDLRQATGRRVRCGLPRTRGDGPEAQSAGFVSLKASPHTRGWTPHQPADEGRIEGFPAHAGMDPDEAFGCDFARRLPRTRGDGPSTYIVGEIPGVASPHTRGWTPDEAISWSIIRSFPAHAGMDPRLAFRRSGCRGLPRTRR